MFNYHLKTSIAVYFTALKSTTELFFKNKNDLNIFVSVNSVFIF